MDALVKLLNNGGGHRRCRSIRIIGASMLKAVQKLRPEDVRYIKYLTWIIFCDGIEQMKSALPLACAHLGQHGLKEGKRQHRVVELHFDLVFRMAEARDDKFHFDSVPVRV